VIGEDTKFLEPSVTTTAEVDSDVIFTFFVAEPSRILPLDPQVTYISLFPVA
jgi:hypothetical protein